MNGSNLNGSDTGITTHGPVSFSADSVESPSDTFCMVEHINSRNRVGFSWRATQTNPAYIFVDTAVHGDSNFNWLFCDGHVSMMKHHEAMDNNYYYWRRKK